LTPAAQLSSFAWRRPAIYAILSAYFLFFSWDRMKDRFAADDMMNMGIYFGLGPWRAFASQWLLWRGFYRPLGAAFYLPLHHWFGLNPVPFQIAIMLLLAFNAYLAFRLAEALGSSDLASGLAALAVSYHAGLSNLQYNIDMVYDILCFTFFIGALLFYIRIRSQGRLLRRGEIAAFLGLYCCALNAKEMAFTFPLVLAAYEWFYHQPVSGRAWLRGPGPVILAAVALDGIDLYGKTVGRDSLLANTAYRPVFSFARLMEFQQASLNDLLGYFGRPSAPGVLAIWILITYLAWRRDRPVLRFCWAYMLITPLPIEFLWGRTQGTLYIPLAGWAVFASVVFLDLVEAAARFLAAEPLLRNLGRAGVCGLLIAGGVLLWAQRMHYIKTKVVEPAAAQQGIQTWDVIQQLRAAQPHVRPQSRVIFLNDPFTDWDMTFIAQLWFHDRTVHVYNQRLQQMSPADVSRMDYIFDFQNGKLLQLK
jgi:hypothetical protein